MNLYRRPFLYLFLLLSLGCNTTNDSQAILAFYHWQTHVDLNDTERHMLEQSTARRMYIKFFDVDWDAHNNEAIPIAVAKLPSTWSYTQEVVPTIFITNRVFQQLPIQETDPLGQKIIEKIKTLANQSDITHLKEIQIDCDWSAGTREPFFRFLSLIRKELKKDDIQLSATIRLHQIRYPDNTGIPPVDRGMLMYYNMGEVRQWEENNSILNNETALPYLSQLNEYPLPLDLALPLFQWGVLFREGEMIRLINQLDESQLTDRSRFYPIADDRYEVIDNTFLDGTFLYKEDLIRLEKGRAKRTREGSRSTSNL
jgi:hypothetical protein